MPVCRSFRACCVQGGVRPRTPGSNGDPDMPHEQDFIGKGGFIVDLEVHAFASVGVGMVMVSAQPVETSR